MTEIKMYKAYDGTRFDTQEACTHYEQEHLQLIHQILDNTIGLTITKQPYYYTIPKNENDFTAWHETLIDLFNFSNYIIIKEYRPECAQYVKCNIGIFIPEEPGMYFYNYVRGQWVKMEER